MKSLNIYKLVPTGQTWVTRRSCQHPDTRHCLHMATGCSSNSRLRISRITFWPLHPSAHMHNHGIHKIWAYRETCGDEKSWVLKEKMLLWSLKEPRHRRTWSPLVLLLTALCASGAWDFQLKRNFEIVHIILASVELLKPKRKQQKHPQTRKTVLQHLGLVSGSVDNTVWHKEKSFFLLLISVFNLLCYVITLLSGLCKSTKGAINCNENSRCCLWNRRVAGGTEAGCILIPWPEVVAHPCLHFKHIQ